MLEPKFAKTLVILNCCILRECYCFTFNSFVCVTMWIGTTAVYADVFKFKRFSRNGAKKKKESCKNYSNIRIKKFHPRVTTAFLRGEKHQMISPTLNEARGKYQTLTN